MCFFNSAQQTYMKLNEPLSTLKSMIFMKYSFIKQTQLSMGKNVLDVPACNTDEIL
jgi:hypothetical protein